jgi:hypothetical protein
MTKVVSLKGKKNIYGSELENAPEDLVYIGRRMPPFMGGWNLKQSLFANPFKTDTVKGKFIKRDGSLEEVCEKYKEYVLSKPELMDELKNLKGKTLACWCSPNKCHGDVLCELIKEQEELQKQGHTLG